MNDNYVLFFEDIDESLSKRVNKIRLDFKIIGYAALALAGLPAGRETKDVDMLKVGALANPKNNDIINFLNGEFGKKSPGLYRHGMYLDLVPENIPWLPPKPKFILFRDFQYIRVFRLDATDTCVSKTFSQFKSSAGRINDRHDIINALENKIVDFHALVRRIDETFPQHEAHAEAPDAFPRVLRFINHEMVLSYGKDNVFLKYEIPSWMENM